MSTENGSSIVNSCVTFKTTNFFSVGANLSTLEINEVPFESTLKEGYRHGVHGMIWAPSTKSVIHGRYPTKAAVFMQMRFDGHIGFPGGLVDDSIMGISVEDAKDKVTEAFVRELQEEINFDIKRIPVTSANYAFSCAHPSLKTFLHFYAVKTTYEEIVDLERRSLEADDFGDEVLGNIRVPLFTMFDGYRGLPAFLNNVFIGNARSQLLIMCERLGILTKDEIKTALESSKHPRDDGE